MKEYFEMQAPLQEVFSDIITLEERIRKCRKDGRKLKRLKRELKQLVRRTILHQPGTTASSDGIAASDDAQAMIESCNTLRFRLIAAALRHEPQACIEQLAEGKPQPAIVQLPGGISYGVLGRNLIILLPELETREQCDAAGADLMKIYDSPQGRRTNWVIDFSSVTAIASVLFFGLVKALKGDLERYGFRLTISWLRADQFPSGYLELLSRGLDLTRNGQYLFSKRDDRSSSPACIGG